MDTARELGTGRRRCEGPTSFSTRAKVLSVSIGVDISKTYYRPTNRAFAALDASGQAALQADIFSLLEQHNRGGAEALIMPSEYLQVVITKE